MSGLPKMMRQGNGVVELHDDIKAETGFGCMMLVVFLTEDGVTEWDDWHGAHEAARKGRCRYMLRCTVYARTAKRLSDNK